MTLLRRLRARFRRRRLDDELHEEIRHHLELRREQLVDCGADPDTAEQEARRRFGNVTSLREEAYVMWSLPSVDTVIGDVRYGVRMIRKHAGFSAAAVLSLAAGIGISTALFSFANSVLFRPIQAAKPAEIIELFTSDFDGPSYGGSSYADYEAFRDRTHVFSGLLAVMPCRATLSDLDRPDVIEGALVSGNYFDVLGLRPSLGRFFLAHESAIPGAHTVVVLSHQAWVRRFGSDPGIVGRTIGLNGHAFHVIGVGPPRFEGTSIERAVEFFVPVVMQAAIAPADDVLRDRRARVFTVFGRLRESVTMTEADAALRVVAAQLLAEDPAAWRDRTGRGRVVTVLPELDARFAGGPGAVAWILSSVTAAVVILLAIACVNVATMLLARATTRRKEIAVRLAIGASRGRVVRQLLTECALLAGIGGLIGVLLAHTAATLLPRFRPDGMPPFDLTLDYRILLFGIGASVLTIAMFGLGPALQTTRPDVNAELKDTARKVKVRRYRIGLRDALVIAQVAVSLALIVGAALLFRSFQASRFADPGFRHEGVLSVEINLSTVAANSHAHARFYRAAVAAIGAMPGVERATFASLVPMDGRNRQAELAIVGSGNATVLASPDINVVGAGYFALMDIAVLRGREFTAADREGAPPVVVVNEIMAREFWKGDAIGAILRDDERNVVFQVVGVVRDLRHRSINEAPRPMVYFCADQKYDSRMTLHVRSTAPAGALGPAIIKTLHELEPAAGLTPAQTMAEHMDGVSMPQRLGGLAAAGIGLLELTLAVMALHGVIAFAMAQRTREIALRMALGATAASVMRLIMREGLVLAAIGIVVGVALALAAAQVAASLLVGVGPADPISFAGASLLVLAVAAAASYLPARRAMRVNPSVALRSE